MMLLLTFALLLALAAMGARRVRRARRRRAAETGLGASLTSAIAIRSYAEMDVAVRARACHCGGHLELAGEGTRETGGRRYRVARLRCESCETDRQLFFDTTDVLH
jgi:hypothetical protein